MAIDRHMPVLVVDDHETMRSMVCGQLRQLGLHDIDETASAAEALAMLGKRRYGLIFSNWRTDGIGGLNLLKAVRASPSLQHVPFVMVSEESRTDNVVAARKAGAAACIVTPFDAQTLKVKIEAILATRSSHLPERAPVATHAPDAVAVADASQHKFPGRFTGPD
jgi:two-component system, chemotaxis family, chemotaxis protein CheY